MEVNKDEKIVLLKFRRARRYAEDNKQEEVNICIIPGGRVVIIKDIFQDRIEVGQASKE